MIGDLYGHMEWADSVVWRAVLASEAASADPKVRGLLYHIHLVQRAYQSVWNGEKPSLPELRSFATLADLASWARAYHSAMNPQAYPERDRILELPWVGELTKRFGRAPAGTTLAQTMVQVAMHSGYHRGQVNMRLRELGEEPPLVDFIAWLWLGRPAAEWPE